MNEETLFSRWHSEETIEQQLKFLVKNIEWVTEYSIAVMLYVVDAQNKATVVHFDLWFAYDVTLGNNWERSRMDSNQSRQSS